MMEIGNGIDAKKHQRNSFTFYDTVMHEESTKRMLLEEGLRRAVLDEEFELYYQPKIDSKNGRIVGVEALIRWNHPTLGKGYHQGSSFP